MFFHDAIRTVGPTLKGYTLLRRQRGGMSIFVDDQGYPHTVSDHVEVREWATHPLSRGCIEAIERGRCSLLVAAEVLRKDIDVARIRAMYPARYGIESHGGIDWEDLGPMVNRWFDWKKVHGRHSILDPKHIATTIPMHWSVGHLHSAAHALGSKEVWACIKSDGYLWGSRIPIRF